MTTDTETGYQPPQTDGERGLLFALLAMVMLGVIGIFLISG